MVKYSEPIDRVFFALSDSTRRQILKKIVEKKVTVSQIAEPFNMSLPAVSKHLKVLENAGIIKRIKEGREITFKLVGEPFRSAIERLKGFTEYWDKEIKKEGGE